MPVSPQLLLYAAAAPSINIAVRSKICKKKRRTLLTSASGILAFATCRREKSSSRDSSYSARFNAFTITGPISAAKIIFAVSPGK